MIFCIYIVFFPVQKRLYVVILNPYWLYFIIFNHIKVVGTFPVCLYMYTHNILQTILWYIYIVLYYNIMFNQLICNKIFILTIVRSNRKYMKYKCGHSFNDRMKKENNILSPFWFDFVLHCAISVHLGEIALHFLFI